jgi:hypothetical protein
MLESVKTHLTQLTSYQGNSQDAVQTTAKGILQKWETYQEGFDEEMLYLIRKDLAQAIAVNGTVDAYQGTHHTGLELRQLKTISYDVEDFELELKSYQLEAPDNLKYWDDILSALYQWGAYVAERSEQELDDDAISLGYESFKDVEDNCPNTDLEYIAKFKADYLRRLDRK